MTDEHFMTLVGDRIQQIRRSRKLTQEDMQNFGFNYRYYQIIESGTANLTLKSLNKLARAFQVSAFEFFRFKPGTARTPKSDKTSH
jgi:transcriptional regulator with XRE-family HTH domain